MADPREFTFVQKRFVVQRLACHETPTAVAKAFKEEFGFEVARNRVSYYDPTTKMGAALDPELKALFHETRKQFLAELDSIPIANRAVRLRALQRQLDYFADKNAAGIVMQLCEAAAKEMGGAFTNQHEHKHSGTLGVTRAHELSDDELAAIAGRGRAGAVAPPPGPNKPH